jgi:hemoglobin
MTAKMKEDIRNRKDIEELVTRFYDKVKPNPVIGFIFTSVANIHWEEHIPVIVDFWETVLLDNPVYKKNAMEPHFALNAKQPLEMIHFTEWLALFTSTVDELFEGKAAELAKTRARSIAAIMQIKMDQINNKNTLP